MAVILIIIGFLFLIASAPLYLVLPLIYLPFAFIRALVKDYM